MQIPLASVFACLFLLNTCIHSSYTLTHTCNKHKHFHSNSEKVSGSLPVCIKLSAPLDGEQPKCVYIFMIFSCRATTPRLHVHTRFALNFITSQNVLKNCKYLTANFSQFCMQGHPNSCLSVRSQIPFVFFFLDSVLMVKLNFCNQTHLIN